MSYLLKISVKPLDVLKAITDSNDAKHGSLTAYINGEDVASVVIDGRIDLEDVARRITMIKELEEQGD